MVKYCESLFDRIKASTDIIGDDADGSLGVYLIVFEAKGTKSRYVS